MLIDNMNNKIILNLYKIIAEVRSNVILSKANFNLKNKLLCFVDAMIYVTGNKERY